MICMIYGITLAPGRRGDYLKEFGRIRNEVRRQHGCIEYEIYVDSTDTRFDNQRRDNVAVIVEKWESIESLQAHGQTRVMDDFRQRVKSLKLVSEYQLLTPYEMEVGQSGVVK